jgi:hypothetical protein
MGHPLNCACGGSCSVGTWLLHWTYPRLTDITAAPLEPIGLIGFAWTSLGPAKTHWIAPMMFSSLVGIANVSLVLCHTLAMLMQNSMQSTWRLSTIWWLRKFLSANAVTC